MLTVDAGCRGVIFDRLAGVKETVSNEGTHFLIPFIQKPIIFDCKARPRNVAVVTGSKGKFMFSYTLNDVLFTILPSLRTS